MPAKWRAGLPADCPKRRQMSFTISGALLPRPGAPEAVAAINSPFCQRSRIACVPTWPPAPSPAAAALIGILLSRFGILFGHRRHEPFPRVGDRETRSPHDLEGGRAHSRLIVA